MRRNFVLSGLSFSLFVDIHDWTEAKHDCRPFSAAAESPDGSIQLAIISIEMMRNSMSGDQATKWSGIESKKQTTKN